MQRILGRTSTHQFLNIINNKSLLNSLLTYHDIMAGENIFGLDIGSLNWKAVQQTPEAVKINSIMIPEGLFECYKNVIIAADIDFFLSHYINVMKYEYLTSNDSFWSNILFSIQIPKAENYTSWSSSATFDFYWKITSPFPFLSNPNDISLCIFYETLILSIILSGIVVMTCQQDYINKRFVFEYLVCYQRDLKNMRFVLTEYWV